MILRRYSHPKASIHNPVEPKVHDYKFLPVVAQSKDANKVRRPKPQDCDYFSIVFYFYNT